LDYKAREYSIDSLGISTSEVTKGKATFKHPGSQPSQDYITNESVDNLQLKKNNKSTKKPYSSTAGSSEMPNRFMKNDQIKEICEKNNLTRMEVYDIRSQFISMVMISEGFLGPTEAPENQGEASTLAATNRSNMKGSSGQQRNQTTGASL
jgi:hypothetical protein